MSEIKTYTFESDELVRKVIVPVIFKNGTSVVKARALIDTGATGNFVTEWIPKTIMAPKLPKTSYIVFAEGGGFKDIYSMDLILSRDVIFKNEEFTAIKDENRDYDAVIGMNILTRTDFSFSNYNGHTIFTFRIPSQEEIKYGDNNVTEADIDNLMDEFEV